MVMQDVEFEDEQIMLETSRPNGSFQSQQSP